MSSQNQYFIDCIGCGASNTPAHLAICKNCILTRHRCIRKNLQYKEKRIYHQCRLCRGFCAKKFCNTCIERKYQMLGTGEINVPADIKEPEMPSIRDIISHNLK